MPGYGGYDDLCKVYSSWVLFNPHASDRNRIRRYVCSERTDEGFCDSPEILDLEEIRVIGIGDPSDADSPIMRSMDVLFWARLDRTERRRMFKEVFKLNTGDYGLERRFEDMYSSLNEEFKTHWSNIGYEKGIVQGKAEVRKEMIDAYSNTVIRLTSSMGLSLDSAMDYVPEDIAEEVRRKVESRL